MWGLETEHGGKTIQEPANDPCFTPHSRPDDPTTRYRTLRCLRSLGRHLLGHRGTDGRRPSASRPAYRRCPSSRPPSVARQMPFRRFTSGRLVSCLCRSSPAWRASRECQWSCRVASSRCSRTSFRSAANSGSMRTRSSVNARRAVAARSRNAIAVSASPLSACAAAA